MTSNGAEQAEIFNIVASLDDLGITEAYGCFHA